ncbi:MAG: flippase [Opitutaceae bacterium]|nr:flippase [Opitutaceae bacterium]
MRFQVSKFFGETSLTERITREFIGLLFERILRLGVGFYVLSSVARYLGSDKFGELSFGLALGSIGAGVATVGTDALIVRESVRQPTGVPAILGTVTALRTLVAIVLSFGLVLILWASGVDSHKILVMMVLFSTTFSAVTAVPTVWFQSQSLGRLPSWASFGVFVVASILRLYLVETKAPLLAFAWVVLVELSAVGIVTGWMLEGYRVGVGTWRTSKQVLVAVLRESWPLWISGIAIVVYMRIDQIILRILAGSKEIGIYSAALRISEQGYLLPMTLSTPLLTALVACERDTTPQTQLMRRYFSVSVVAAYAYILAIWIAAPPLYQIFFGPEYHESIKVIKIHVLGAPFVFIGVARTQVLITWGMMRFAMWSTIVGAVVNLSLNLFLAARFGAMGAAWSSVGAQVVAAWLSSWVYRPTRQLAREQTAALLMPWSAFLSRTHQYE